MSGAPGREAIHVRTWLGRLYRPWRGLRLNYGRDSRPFGGPPGRVGNARRRTWELTQMLLAVYVAA